MTTLGFEGHDHDGFLVSAAHFSQKKREMGHPAASIVELLTRRDRGAGDPSLRLKSGYVQDDNRKLKSGYVQDDTGVSRGMIIMVFGVGSPLLAKEARNGAPSCELR